MSEFAKVCLQGQWVESKAVTGFRAVDPVTGEEVGDVFPVSPWEEIEQALAAASEADRIIRDWPGERFAEFLENYAARLETSAERLVALAHQETALVVSPRLQTGELPRTVNQLKTAAICARSGSWALPVIDEAANIHSCYRSLGPVLIFGPNNFPLAFNSISGGDFAAAIAAGNPVIAKGHPAHPGTTELLAELALAAAEECGFPAGFIQMLYHMASEDGLKAIRDSRVAAVAFTGSRSGGLKIKEAADQAGKPVYAEMSSINPVFILPGAFQNGVTALAEEFAGSCLMASGQFCTNPGLVILPPGTATEEWIAEVQKRFAESHCGPLFAAGVRDQFLESVQQLQAAGAELLTGGEAVGEQGFRVASTLLKISAAQFLRSPEVFQQEAFGNGSLLVVTEQGEQMTEIAALLEGQLTGCVYLTDSPDDEACYQQLEPVLRRKVGRLLNNKMPTGVAVSPAMNHGGPFPSTGHPGFTAVGLPAAIRRFGMLQCYDNVPTQRLPALLKQS